MFVTPNTLSEVSNLLDRIMEPAKTEIYTAFKAMIGRVHECYIKSSEASERVEFLRLGLSDSVLLELSREQAVVLTVDIGIYLAALKQGYEVLNFNHCRDL